MPLLFARQNSSPAMWRFGLLPGKLKSYPSTENIQLEYLEDTFSKIVVKSHITGQPQQRLVAGKESYENVWTSICGEIIGRILYRIVPKSIKIQI